jgi:uncharacterized protein (DUF885 family)
MINQPTIPVRAASVAVALSALLYGGTAFAQASEDHTAAFYTFLEEQFEAELLRSPLGLTQEGRRERYDEWDDFSDEAVFDQLAFDQAQLDALHEQFDYDQLTSEAQVSYLLFEADNEQSIEGAAWYRHSFPLNPLFNFPTGVTSILANSHQIASVEDAEAYISRVAELERAFDQFADRVRDRTAFGVLPPDWVYPQITEALGNLGAVSDEAALQHPMYADFSTKVDALEIDDAEKERLLAEVRGAITGPLARGLESLMGAIAEATPLATTQDGVWRMPDGEAYYEYRVRLGTGLDMTAEEIHNFGLAEIERIKGEMREIMAEVGFDGTLEEFFAFMRNDEQFAYANTDDGRAEFIADAEAAVARIEAVTPQYFNILPRADLEVRRVEAYREAVAPGAFYSSPARDGSRPGIFYANLSNMDEWRRDSMEALVFHEAVPGHHFQSALQVELEGVPSFQRNLFFFSYMEGWGLYAERLAHEMGAYSDAYSEFGRLSFELWRAARLVVDTGVHYHRWDLDQAIAFMQENTALTDEMINNEARRYVVWPGQALSYKMGMTEILRLRAHAQEELGDQFDIRDFHDVVLANGAVPMSVLNVLVENYIAAERAE